MNKIIIVNLNGNAYQLEEPGYNALRAYLEDASHGLRSNPDREEIMVDIEQAIAEKFRATLGQYKSVVETKEVRDVLAAMGPVHDGDEQPAPSPSTAGSAATQAIDASFAGANTEPPHTTTPGAKGTSDWESPARRLYKIPEGAMIAGVCNGIAAYLALDPVVVRLVFAAAGVFVALIALVVDWFMLLPIAIYGGLALVLPAANTAAERTAARGDPSTAREYIRRAKHGYYRAARQFSSPVGRREWKRKYRQKMQGRAYGWNQYAGSSASSDHWSSQPPGAFAPRFVLPFLGLLQAALVFGFVFCLVRLLSHGNLLGATVPSDWPLWVSIVALVLVFQLVTWPVKALRYACWSGFDRAHAHPIYPGFLDSLVWLAACVAGIWVADHYIPAVHSVIVTLPAKMTEVAAAVKEAWAHHSAP